MTQTQAVFEVQAIAAEDTYVLRQSVLRPMQSLAECAYPVDHEPETLHAGCYRNGQLVGVGTIFREKRESSEAPGGWRVRGMAVSPEARGSGCGGAVLEALLAHAEKHSLQGEAFEVWCNGRVNVEGFYQRYGFQREGDIFDVPPIGLHVVMVRHTQI